MTDERHAYVKASPTAGNGLFASKALEPGQLIFSLPHPLIGVLDIPRLSDTCSNCFVWTAASAIRSRGDILMTVKACTGCRVLRYCSKSCQARSWKRHHKHECKILGGIGKGDQLPNAVRAVMQILIMRKHGLITDDVWASLLGLESHIDEKRAAGGEPWQQIEVLAMGAWSYSGTQGTFDFELAKQMFARVLTNSLTIVTPTFDPLGICLDPFAASANHSCDPNAVVLMDVPEISFRSLKAIPKDGEILISYIDISNPFARRQYELKARYHFTCACSKCQQGPTLREDEFLQPVSRLLMELTELATTIGQRNPALANDPANYVGDDEDLKKLAILQGVAFEGLETARSISDPQQAIETLEECMRLCHRTKMWPLYRQPFPALRHELFVNLISAGRYDAAFTHGVKTYFEIDPVLFPYPYHPVRVVHTWTFAMLAIYIAGEQDHSLVQKMLQHGIALGVIIHQLLLEVGANVNKSHGAQSSLNKIVRLKMREIMREIGGPDSPKLDRMFDIRGDLHDMKREWKDRLRQVAEWVEL